MILKNRKYSNAYEIARELEETEETISGYSDIVKKDTELLKQVIYMVDNKDNDEGRKMAVLLCKHPKLSIRDLCDDIMKGVQFEVEDRSSITL